MPELTADLNTTEEMSADLGEALPGAKSLYALAVERGLWAAGDFAGFLASLQGIEEPVAARIIDPSTGEPYDRVPSAPGDADGEIPLRSQLTEILEGLGALPTETADVPLQDVGRVAAALLDSEGSEVDVAGLLAQVLDAVGQIPTEAAGGWQYTEWLDASTLAVATQETVTTDWGLMAFPPLITQATIQLRFDTWSDDGGVGDRGELLVAPRIEALNQSVFSDDRFSVPSSSGYYFLQPSVVRAGVAGVVEYQGVPMSYPLTGAIGAGTAHANEFDGKSVAMELGARKQRDNARQWEVRNAQIRLAYQQ